ncbi:MAG: radical SAM protein [Fusobacteriaceae bacterium]
MNIHYFNINYICNNSCIFCISPSTFERREEIKLKTINSLSSIPRGDRVIINGGEPTIHPDFFDIINSFEGTELVLYSNGVKLSNLDFVKKLCSYNCKRITIPIHGNEQIHDYVTKNKGSYKKTIQGIKNLIENKNKIEIEMKFILTSELINSDIDLLEILKQEKIDIKKIDSFILAGLVNSSVCKMNNIEIPSDENLGNYASKLIKKLEDSTIKIEDIKFCSLNEELLEDINKNYPFEQKNIYKNFMYYDFKNTCGNLINYKKITEYNSKCPLCKFNDFCNSIMDNYHILIRKNKKWFVDIE